MDKNEISILAFYLPQFHPIPENDKWWGKGFTEWTNTAKARPLFKGHYQPHIPADLGFYDLRVPETREEQAKLAKDHKISGFCYWHYWFGNGKRLLEHPFNEVLETGKPDFPFCLAWANQSWTGTWHGLKDNILIEQKYPGKQDYIDHFNHLLEAFHDHRYIVIDNKPVFVVYSPNLLPDSNLFTDTWNELAVKNGFDGVYFIGIHYIGWDHKAAGFNEKTIHQPSHYVKIFEENMGDNLKGIFKRRVLTNKPVIYDYGKLMKAYDFDLFLKRDFIPTIIPGWDNSPRSGNKGWVFHNSTPLAFKKHFAEAVSYILKKPVKNKILFIKSWNEWAEGNYLEPDLEWGLQYLEAIREVVTELDIQTGGRRQKTEDRSQKTEDRRQKTGDRRQESGLPT